MDRWIISKSPDVDRTIQEIDEEFDKLFADRQRKDLDLSSLIADLNLWKGFYRTVEAFESRGIDPDRAGLPLALEHNLPITGFYCLTKITTLSTI